jgi:hypothetical protein
MYAIDAFANVSGVASVSEILGRVFLYVKQNLPRHAVDQSVRAVVRPTSCCTAVRYCTTGASGDWTIARGVSCDCGTRRRPEILFV